MQLFNKSNFIFGVIKKQVRLIASNNEAVKLDRESQLDPRPWQEIPGPSIWTMMLYFTFHRFMPSNLEELGQLYKQYGPIFKINGLFGSPSYTFILDSKATSLILRNENSLPVRIGFQSMEYFRNKNKKVENSDKPTSLLTEHGELWKKLRSTVNTIFLQPKNIEPYKKKLNKIADDMIAKMRFIRNNKNVLEGKFDEEICLWSLESIAVVAFGSRLNCIDPNLQDDSPEKQMISTVNSIFKFSEELDFKPNLWRYISTPLFRRVMNLHEKQEQLTKFFIEQAIEEVKHKDKVTEEEMGILGKMIKSDRDMATNMVRDMFLVGIETTAYTVIATLYLLAINPQTQKKLRKAILSKPETRSYLKACIKESMRILPVAAGNMRTTTKEYDVLGYRIPKGTFVSFGNQYLSLLEENFTRSKEYIPERWITDKSDLLHHSNAHPLAFCPFGFGVRSCIGRRIADTVMETFLVKVIENFHVEWFGPPLKIIPSTLNYIVEPFNFVFKDVK